MTTLYIKTHNLTGLKYFGKTTKNPVKYKGSGLYWKRHIRKYGNELSTEIIGTYEDNSVELIEAALTFSKENNIVKSEDWANLKPENGLDGGSIEKPETFFKKSNKLAKKLCKVYTYGRNLSEEHKNKISEGIKNIPKDIKLTSDKNRSKALKGRVKSKQECKNISEALKGKKKSKEHIENNRLSNIGRISAFDVFNNITVTTNEMDFLENKHFIGIQAKKFFIVDDILMRGKDLEIYAKSKGFKGTNFAYKSNKFRLKFISSIKEINREQYIEELRQSKFSK